VLSAQQRKGNSGRGYEGVYSNQHPYTSNFSESAAINMTTQRQGMPITSADYQAMLPQAAATTGRGMTSFSRV
jgi:hypothetical protein